MHLNFKKIIFIISFFTQVICATAQTKFTATISPAQINKDEYTTLRLVVENANNIQNITAPSLQNFYVVSGPNQESGMSNVNGTVTQYVAISYVLQPRKPGQVRIGPGIAIVGGNVLKSNPLKLIINNEASARKAGNTSNTNPLAAFADPFENSQPAAPDFKDYILHKGENVQDKVAKNMQLRLQADKTSCFVGEPLVATYKLYTRLKSESKLAKNPAFNGFSVIDLSPPNISDFKRETLNGRDYNVYTIRKAQLYPLQAGDIELETAVLDNDIQFLKDDGSNNPNSVNDLVNGFNMGADATVTESVSLSSKPVTITVKPLPEAGKPASFKGAVGIFNVETGIEKNSFSTDETGSFAIRISGNGNLQLLNVPPVQWPDGIDVFDPKVTDNTVVTTVPVSGSKTYVYSFAAQKAGDYILPAVSFSYFDPATASYKTIETKPLNFTVTKGTGKPVYKIKSLQQAEGKNSFLDSIFSHRWWIVAFIALVMFTALVFWVRKENKKDLEERLARQNQMAEERLNAMVMESSLKQQNPLQETEGCLYQQECSAFYVTLNKEMKAFIAGKFSLEVQQINSKTIATALDAAGINNSTVLALQQLMQEIEWQVYTPFIKDNRTEMYSRSHDIIQDINGQA